MNKGLFCIVMCLVFAAQMLQAQQPSIILGRPTATSIRASILFSSTARCYLVYGNKQGIAQDSTDIQNAQAGVPLIVDVHGLQPNTRYYYHLMTAPQSSANFSALSEHSFITQRAPNTGFRFCIEADEHLYDKKGVRNMYKVTLDNQARDSADFMISLGDIFGDDHTPTTTTSADMKALHNDYLQYLGAVCHSMPFYVCLGNHEGENGYYLQQTPPDNIAVYGTLWRKYYYPNPEPNEFYSGNTTAEGYGMDLPQNYYAWTWGDALFVVLDVYRHCSINEKPQNWDWTIGDQQYAWLLNTLKNSKAKYKFVFSHHLRGQGRGAKSLANSFEWGGYDASKWRFDEKRPGWELPIHQLMVKYGVTIFFQGHDHLYAREELDGLVYQEVPMAADSTYTIGMLANADAYTDLTLDGTGHIRVDVQPSGVSVDFVRAYLPADTLSGQHHNREIAHHYVVQARPTEVEEQRPDVQTFAISTGDNADEMLVRCPLEDCANATLEVFDIAGHRIDIDDHRSAQGFIHFDTAHLTNGVYCIRVVTSKQTFSSSFTVMR